MLIILFYPTLDKFYCIGAMKLVENDLLWFVYFVHIKISYYFFNRQELL